MGTGVIKKQELWARQFWNLYLLVLFKLVSYKHNSTISLTDNVRYMPKRYEL
jgi:hypothetical protein